MAFNDQNCMSPADMAAVLGNERGSGNGGWGFGDNGAWWILILFLFAANNGWGTGFGGGNGGAIPYMMSNNTNNDVQRGFDQQAIMGGLNGLTAAVSNGFSNAEVSRCNAQANLLQTLNSSNNAITANMNSLAMGLQNCCCENRAGLADLKYTIATENCADRAAISDGIRDVIASNTASTQAILDKLCQQEIDTLKAQNENLRTQLNIEALKSSQADQTAAILSNNAAQTQALEQYLNPAPIPAYMVQNPNCCATNYNSCGCGCN